MSGSIQVSSKEMASVGHEAEFRSWCGTLMTMVLYGVMGHIAGHVSPLHFCHAQAYTIQHMHSRSCLG